jgi:anti-anti-sigma factor
MTVTTQRTASAHFSGVEPVLVSIRQGAMPVPQTLNVSRHGGTDRTLISLTGEIDVDSTPLLRETVASCLLDGVRGIDIDLTAVTFCDCSGVNALLSAARRAAAAGGTVRVHHPPPMLVRLFALTGADVLVAAAPAAPVRSGLAPAVPALPGGAP